MGGMRLERGKWPLDDDANLMREFMTIQSGGEERNALTIIIIVIIIIISSAGSLHGTFRIQPLDSYEQNWCKHK